MQQKISRGKLQILEKKEQNVKKFFSFEKNVIK